MSVIIIQHQHSRSNSRMQYDRHIVGAVRDHLFQRPGGPFTGLDLIAVNIQRARDHGVPSYNEYREMCAMPKAVDFDDLKSTMDDETVDRLKSVYTSVDDIDLFSGMMSELPLEGTWSNVDSMTF